MGKGIRIPSVRVWLAAVAAAGIFTVGVGVRGNHSPVQGEDTVTGLPVPAEGSPLVVTGETLTIDIAPPTPAPPRPAFGIRSGAPQGFGTSPVRVAAEYRIRNPTGGPVEVPLAFPVFNQPFGPDPKEAAWYGVTQDGVPLAATVDDPVWQESEWVRVHQQEWVRRLDAWVAERPDAAAGLARVRAHAPDDGAARDTLDRALGEGVRRSDAMLALGEAGTLDEQFAAVLRLLPQADARFGVVGRNGQVFPILNERPVAYAGHREEWTRLVRAWLNARPGVAAALPAYRAQLAREAEAAALRDVLDTTHGLKGYGPSLLNAYSGRAPGDPFTAPPPPAADWRGSAIVVPPELAATLWSDAARELAAAAAARTTAAARWGGDARLLSPLTGRLFYPADGRGESEALERLLAEGDAEPGRPVAKPPAAPALLRYTVRLPAGGETTVRVAYDGYMAYDEPVYGMSYAVVEQWSYVLETVKYWKGFGPIAVKVTAPADRVVLTWPELPRKAGADPGAGRVAYAATLDHPTQNLHIALMPPADRSESLFGMLPAEEASVGRLGKLLPQVRNTQARAVLRACLANVLVRVGRRYEAWEQVLAGRKESDTAVPWERALSNFWEPGHPTAPQQMWEFIEAKSRSPLLKAPGPSEDDRSKDDLWRFGENAGDFESPEFLEDDYRQLSRRLAAWDFSKGTVQEQICAHFLFARAGVDRDGHLKALVELADAHDESAVLALRLLAVLPGDKGVAFEFVRKHMAGKLGGAAASAETVAALQAFRFLGGATTQMAHWMTSTNDKWERLGCMEAMAETPVVSGEAIAAVRNLGEDLFSDEMKGRYYLHILSHNRQEGFAALREIARGKSAWAMRAAALLADQGEAVGLEGAIAVFNHGAVGPDVGSEDRQELSAACRVLSLNMKPGLLKRLAYRKDVPEFLLQQVMRPLVSQPDPDAWPFLAAYYEQYARGQEDLSAGWLGDALAGTGDPRAEPLLREMARHGNMGDSCARALGRLLYPPPPAATRP
jgi:hypothetical protein